MSQSLAVLISTLAATLLAGFSFMYFSDLFQRGGALRDEFAVIYENKVLYSTVLLSNTETTELFMNISVGIESFTHGGVRYRAFFEEAHFPLNTPEYRVIRFVPEMDPGVGPVPLIAFTGAVFLVVFAIGNFITHRRNNETIITPLVKLKKQTEDIRRGDVNTEVAISGFGELGGLAAAIEDLRVELKNAVYYRQRVDENRKFLISSISHDLKTPVTSIRGYIDGVLDGVAGNEEKREEYLKKAVLKTILMNTMIDDLLLFSKLDLNQIPFEINRTVINSYMRSLVNEYSFDFEREGKTIFFEDTLKREVYVRIDSGKMKRVVQNIFDNAKKNIENGKGWLKVIIREGSAAVLIEFRDNGKGIYEKDLPNIFDRFYRGDRARTADGSGGLGLAIAKHMVEGMGGRIWASSKDSNGASFIVSLKKEM